MEMLQATSAKFPAPLLRRGGGLFVCCCCFPEACFSIKRTKRLCWVFVGETWLRRRDMGGEDGEARSSQFGPPIPPTRATSNRHQP